MTTYFTEPKVTGRHNNKNSHIKGVIGDNVAAVVVFESVALK